MVKLRKILKFSLIYYFQCKTDYETIYETIYEEKCHTSYEKVRRFLQHFQIHFTIFRSILVDNENKII